MARRKFHVSEALAANQDVITDLMTGAKYTDSAELPSLELSRTVTFRGREYTHVTVNSFLTGDRPWDDRPSELVPFSPALSLMLHAGADARTGLVTRVDYAGFGLDKRYYDRALGGEDGGHLGALLLADSFEVSRGANFCDPDTVLGGGYLGSDAERGAVSRLAAETIGATSELVRGIGFEALAELHDY